MLDRSALAETDGSRYIHPSECSAIFFKAEEEDLAYVLDHVGSLIIEKFKWYYLTL